MSGQRGDRQADAARLLTPKARQAIRDLIEADPAFADEPTMVDSGVLSLALFVLAHEWADAARDDAHLEDGIARIRQMLALGIRQFYAARKAREQ